MIGSVFSPHRGDVALRLLTRLVEKNRWRSAVRRSIFLLITTAPGTQRVDDANQIFTQLWMVIVDVAAMKESHLFAVLLLTGGELAVSAAEGAETIFRQRTPVIDVERRVEPDGAPVLSRWRR